MSRRAAFTLIQFLIVIAIIALLIAMLIPAISRARRAAEKATCAAQLANLAAAVEMYLKDNASLPVSRKTRLSHFQRIRTNRQAGKRVAAIGPAVDGARSAGIGLRSFDLGAGHGRTAGVPNRSANLSC